MKLRSKILIVLILIILAFGAYFIYENIINNKEEVKVVKTIKGYGYTLDSGKPNLYVKKFKELSDILKKEDVDYDEYAKKVSELFIIDFYTLDNKLSKNDIGGVEFIEDSIKDNFIEKARSTFYKYLVIKESRTEKLPEVSSIDSVELQKYTFTYTDKTTDENAYKVSIKWSYKEDLDYEDSKDIILVKRDKKLCIIEMD